MLVLASASPRRAELLERVGVPFERRLHGVEGLVRAPEQTPEQFALRAAATKATAADPEGADIVLGLHTVVAVDGEVLGVPADEAEALSMLQRLQGRTHEVYTAWRLVLIARRGNREGWARTEVECAHAEAERLRAYIATSEPMKHAGGYAIDGAGAFLVESITGSYTNMLGLPLAQILYEIGFVGGIQPWTRE